MNINGNVLVPAGPLASGKELNAVASLFSRANRYDGVHFGRVRVDYMLGYTEIQI